jgi:hypothetical protein
MDVLDSISAHGVELQVTHAVQQRSIRGGDACVAAGDTEANILSHKKGSTEEISCRPIYLIDLTTGCSKLVCAYLFQTCPRKSVGHFSCWNVTSSHSGYDRDVLAECSCFPD